MIFLYKTDNNKYQVIKDDNAVETVIGEYLDEESAVIQFNETVAEQRKTTLMEWNGKTVIDYRENK